MHRSVLAVALSLTAAASTLADERIRFRQDFGPVQTSHTINGGQTDIPELVFEFGPAFMDLVEGDNGVQNPAHAESTRTAMNPLYEGDNRGASLASQISTMTYDFGALTEDASGGGGIVHRDVAVRNMVMETDFGTYTTLVGDEFIFGSDAPAEYFATGQVTWVTPSTIRLYLDGDESSGDYFEFIGTWFTDTLVPAPGATALFGLGLLGAARRRR